MKHIFKIMILGLLVITSCKTKKDVVGTNRIHNISAKKIINNHYSNKFNQQTIYARLSAKYRHKKTSATITIKLRLEKDKTIWMSATKFGLPIAKVKITPNRVMYYEKLRRTYFDGDFSLLSNWLGTELDYEKVQNILLGQAVLNLKKGRYNSKIENNLYELSPKKENELFGILFFLNPENFKLNKQEIRHPEKKQLLAVSYPKYNKILGEQFPKKINIRAIDNKNITTINIEYRSVEFNRKLSFPFSIPRGYKKIRLK
ncbi:MAG: deoxyuridine 5'-triphosphate nucleotidohydrolase [Lutibacter sp.]|nr:MAG: deoxyuridine 5'-triphosphate nucleotidohydrolase [Lutibacter sp.]